MTADLAFKTYVLESASTTVTETVTSLSTVTHPDQEQALASSGVGDLKSGQSFGQTFTAGRTGRLTELGLVIGCSLETNTPCSGEPVTVRIYSGDFTAGSPAPAGDLLAETSLPASSFSGFNPAQHPSIFITFTFSSPPSVVAGNVYAIIITHEGSSPAFVVGDASGNPYPSGGEWYYYAGSWSANAGCDLAFRTYVTETSISTVISYVTSPTTVTSVSTSFVPTTLTETSTSVSATTETSVSTEYVPVTVTQTTTVTGTTTSTSATTTTSTEPSYTLTVRVNSGWFRPVAGATVTLDGVYVGTTDSYGRLVIQGVSAGSHQLVISKTGYKDYTATISVTSNKTVTATLTRI